MITDCIFVSVILILMVLGIDQLLRIRVRKKRTKVEKQSLMVGVACIPAYVLMSILGILLAIAAGIVMRKRGNPQGAKLAQLAAMGYIAVFGILCMASGLL